MEVMSQFGQGLWPLIDVMYLIFILHMTSNKTGLDLWDCFGRKKHILQQNFIGLI